MLSFSSQHDESGHGNGWRAQVGRLLAVQEALARRLLGPAEYYRLGPALSENGDKARWETRSAR